MRGHGEEAALPHSRPPVLQKSGKTVRWVDLGFPSNCMGASPVSLHSPVAPPTCHWHPPFPAWNCPLAQMPPPRLASSCPV